MECLEGYCWGEPADTGLDATSDATPDATPDAELDAEADADADLDTEDTYIEVCEEGYRADPSGQCVDIDECAEDSDACDLNATCTNTDGGFECACNGPTYVGDGATCTLATDCSNGNATCDANADCTEVGEQSICQCRSGYAGDGLSCADIDECLENTDDCDPLATCTNTEGGFTCSDCPTGYTDVYGDATLCEDIDECATGAHDCSAWEVCANTPGNFTCACAPGAVDDGTGCRLPTSCLDALNNGLTSDGVYTLALDASGPADSFEAYCDMSTDGGGWTLAIKADGRESTFEFHQDIWENTTLLNPTSPGLNRTEAKLATFNTLAFSEVMIGLEHPIKPGISPTFNYLVLPIVEDSLYDIFTGSWQPTNVGRATWLNTISGSALQQRCNREGFNRSGSRSDRARVRIGILGNEQRDCNSPDSFLGIGGGGVLDSEQAISVGNIATSFNSNSNSSQADVYLPAFGVVYVR